MGKIKTELKKLADPEKAKILQKFFKTGKGEYGEGDQFLGIVMPKLRNLAKKYFLEISIPEILKLLKSKIHEERMLALLILMSKYKTAAKKFEKNHLVSDAQTLQKIFTFYLLNTKHINNWDLVDITCRDIVGAFLFTSTQQNFGKGKKEQKILYELAKSKNIWERRIAIVSTYYFIQRNDLNHTFKIAKMLLADKHDLIHKAGGWMLREAGKKDKDQLVKFLNENSAQMPRTMLRYAIEKFSPIERCKYLKKAGGDGYPPSYNS